MIESKVYVFKDEFCKELKIPMNQAERKLEELLEWLTNFYDFNFYKGHPNRIEVKVVYGDYQPLPRKKPSQEKLNKEKTEDYTNFTIASLSPEYKPNSKSKIARDAIKSFGQDKYGHTNQKWIAQKYIKEPFEKYGETDDKNVWVFCSTYEPMGEQVVEDWHMMLRRAGMGVDEAANAFYRYAEGEDVSKELNYYKTAREEFQDKYNDFPVLVKSWKLKSANK